MSYAGDITPEEAWKILNDEPQAVLVDCRTDAEWRFVGVPDLTGLGREVVYVEWNRTDGSRNESFVDDLVAAGVDQPGDRAGGVPVPLRKPFDRGREGRHGSGHRAVLQRPGRIRGRPRREQAPRGHRLEGRRPALEAVVTGSERDARIAARSERGAEKPSRTRGAEKPSVRTPAELPEGVSQATIGVRGGLMRSGFEETAEAIYPTSGYVYAERGRGGEGVHR